MYRIQAHNIVLGRIEIFIVNSMHDRERKIKSLEENSNYGLITFEFNPRGAFYR